MKNVQSLLRRLHGLRSELEREAERCVSRSAFARQIAEIEGDIAVLEALVRELAAAQAGEQAA